MQYIRRKSANRLPQAPSTLFPGKQLEDSYAGATTDNKERPVIVAENMYGAAMYELVGLSSGSGSKRGASLTICR